MLKQLVMVLSILTLFGTFALAQDQTATDKKDKKECSNGCCSGHKSPSTMQMSYMDSDSTHGKHHEMKSEVMSENSIVRQGEIDLAAIDMNEDGKVYQDPMDWNVISDEAGECSLCGMMLKEVSLEKAKENLLQNGFKVK